MFEKYQPQWLSKDVLVLFYDDSQVFLNKKGREEVKIGENYGQSVKEFFDNYYKGYDLLKKDDLGQLLDSKKRIQGRNGYIRNGYSFIIKDYAFNQFLFKMDGTNGKLSDLD